MQKKKPATMLTKLLDQSEHVHEIRARCAPYSRELFSIRKITRSDTECPGRILWMTFDLPGVYDVIARGSSHEAGARPRSRSR